LSREQYPKQLLALAGGDTMLQASALRLQFPAPDSHYKVLAPLIVSNEEYRFITAEQLRQINVVPAALILEPAGRNTAPAVTLAALATLESGEDPVLVVMPADHVIGDQDAFIAAVKEGAQHAMAGKLVTFGIVPTHPETGYGYIRLGDPLSGGSARDITSFVEKPDSAVAQQYVRSGEYLWNSGIFMMRASVWLEQLGIYRPDILNGCRSAFAERTQDNDFLRVNRKKFLDCPADSIDYAVMEKLPQGLGVVIPLAAKWSDVGAWDALWQILPKDEAGNSSRGDVIAIATRSSLIISQSRLVACVGLDDTVVVETPDAVLVARKDRVQEVKQIVAKLKQEKRSEANAHRKIYRPWGYYDSVDGAARFQVKRIVVNPGATLSLQMHHHRAEHWIVVTGTARVTCGEKVFLLGENESTFIPLGQTHRLENPGKVPLEMIEVQSGAYLGEDDIVRFEDNYGRT
jgi:mannose-1-phosphate guanylyltransferase/mannose-6-phosphate isomerase